VIAALLATLVASGCYDPRETPAAQELECAGCHGTAQSPAPPPGLWLTGSQSETSARGVGAHAAHLGAKSFSLPVSCDTCHKVPKTVDEPGHLDGATKVVFSGLAVARETKADWDGTSCAVYCHSGTLGGGSVTRPKWTQVDGTQAACGSCHGLPPKGTHPPSVSACSTCHDKTVDAKNTILDLGLHLNGQVEVRGGTCSSCHGSAANAAPPVDTQGHSAVTARGVGAHQAHVRGSTLHTPFDCGECHVKPSSVSSPGHTDHPLPAIVAFGALAKTAGKQPVYDPKALTCAQSYCHAGSGAGAPTPAWNKGEAAVCGSCHGLPPTTTRSKMTHPQVALADCVNCHKTVNAAGQIVKPDRHVNGKVDFN
jgi:predicted CxxxxCH...CXXCH cytochrome family protein